MIFVLKIINISRFLLKIDFLKMKSKKSFTFCQFNACYWYGSIHFRGLSPKFNFWQCSPIWTLYRGICYHSVPPTCSNNWLVIFTLVSAANRSRITAFIYVPWVARYWITSPNPRGDKSRGFPIRGYFSLLFFPHTFRPQFRGIPMALIKNLSQFMTSYEGESL